MAKYQKIICLTTDITERKMMEIKNRKQTEKHIQDIENVKECNEKRLEKAPDVIANINHNEEIELFNKAAEEL